MCKNVVSTYERLKSMATVTSFGSLVFIGYSIHQAHEQFYDRFIMPLVRLFDPEWGHKMAILSLKYGLVSPQMSNSPRLHSNFLGLEFENPLGIAAGFDKQGEAVRGLHRIGFGFVEVGSVTPQPQPGNPKPRVFRLLEDKAVINRYGFNSDGHEIVYGRLKNLKTDGNFTGIIGVNLGKNKNSNDPINDYVEGIKKFSEVADYFVINISSPNTPNLRNLQSKENLEQLLQAVNDARSTLRKPPLLLKLAPDLTNQELVDVAEVIRKSKSSVDGLILTNTTVERPNLLSKDKNEIGGLSGAPLAKKSTQVIADMYRLTQGKIPIIGSGGIFNGEDAYEKIRSGASLIQIYTSYIYHGPPVINRIRKELDVLLERDGFSSISQAVGIDVNLKK